MASGRPLTDADRLPWLEAQAAALEAHAAAQGGGAVLACSALQPEYRRVLRGSSPPGAVAFVSPQSLPGRRQPAAGSLQPAAALFSPQKPERRSRRVFGAAPTFAPRAPPLPAGAAGARPGDVAGQPGGTGGGGVPLHAAVAAGLPAGSAAVPPRGAALSSGPRPSAVDPPAGGGSSRGGAARTGVLVRTCRSQFTRVASSSRDEMSSSRWNTEKSWNTTKEIKAQRWAGAAGAAAAAAAATSPAPAAPPSPAASQTPAPRTQTRTPASTPPSPRPRCPARPRQAAP